MDEKAILKSIEKGVLNTSSTWTFNFQGETLSKEDFLRKLRKDEQFQQSIVALVASTSKHVLSIMGKRIKNVRR